MAILKLRLSSKTVKENNDDTNNGSYNKEIGVKQEMPITSPTTIKLKPHKALKTTSKKSTKASKSTLPRIKFKTSDSLQSIKFKPLDPSGIPSTTSIPDTLIKKRAPTLRVKPVRLPGNGYDSEDPDREDDPLIEEAIVLRFLPDEYLDTIRSAIESSERNDKSDKNNLSLDLKSDLSNISVTWKDKRRAIVRFNDIMYGAKLVNLPTISEVHKTIDKKNIFKTVDVSQMLLCVKRIYDENEINDIKIDKEYGETYPDGLTPPMEFAKERFQKKYETSIIQNVEDEVARLLKLDGEAESSIYEFIDADEENLAPMSVIEAKLRNKRAKKEKKKRRKELERLQKEKENNKEASANNFDDLDSQFEDIDTELDRLMQEDNDEIEANLQAGHEDDDEEDEEDDEEDEEEEEEEDDDDDDEADEYDGNHMAEPNTKLQSENEEEEDEDDDDDEEDEDDDDDDEVVNDELRNTVDDDEDGSSQHNALLYEEITELKSMIAQKEQDLMKAINPIMKNRITDVISRLQQELDIKQSQIVENVRNKKENSSHSHNEEDNDDNDDNDDNEDNVDHEDEQHRVHGENDDEDNHENDVTNVDVSEDEDEDREDYDDLF